MKPVEFLGDSLDALRSFPRTARREVGFQLDRVQRGLDPDDWKPLRTVAASVREIRIRDEAGAFRVIYYAKLEDAIYVLHCFQKKARKTALSDIELSRKRFRALMGRKR